MKRPIVVKTYLSLAPAKGAAVTAWLAAGLATLMSWVAWNDDFGLARFLDADRTQVFARHEWWRLFTAPWVHAGPDHLLDNLPFLLGLTFLTAGYFGRAAVAALAFAAGAVIEALTLYFYPEGVTLVGASGIVYFLAGLWLTMVFVIEARRQTFAQRLVACVGIALALLAPHSYEPHVSYAAHLIGFLLGPLGALILYPGLRARIAAAEVVKAPAPPEPFPDLLAEYSLSEPSDDLDELEPRPASIA